MELKVGDKIKVKGTIFADSLGDIFEAEIIKVHYYDHKTSYAIKAINKNGYEYKQYFDTHDIERGVAEIVSHENFDIVESIEEERHVNKCSCDIRLLMTSGCKCGGI